MKQFLLIFLFMMTGINVSAQRDTEHWIAPFYASSGVTQSLYLSTDSVTPFVVTVYSNNIALGTVTISKGNPQTYIVSAANISATSTSEGFAVINKGLYLNGEKPFYCTLRIVSSTTHAEILTSKGKAGIGKEFFVANTPSPFVSTGNNFTAGVLATEDNTTVTATWSNTITVSFYGATPTTNTHTFTLNKGQSFIFAGAGSPALNMQSFIGAKIVADKPITLTNGNVLGNFGAASSQGADIILDQSVPLERLGNTFAMVKSRSPNASDIEGGIVVATENNTQVFLNGAATPAATLNAGQWYRISGSDYILQGGTHRNMFISSSKNIYLYQLVSVDGSNATCGFNYIPPLNCFLPRKIDEIGKINEMPTGAGGASATPSGTKVKLNILTEVGATVLVNNVAPTAAEGPYPVTGNTNWVTYALESVSGNLTISSNKAVTAGINGGYSTSGYGGYFAGFSSIPLIAKQTGVCIPGLVLEVDDSYDTYQWFRNDVPIPGANSNSFTPVQSGNYTVRITVGSCPPATTPPYKVFTCLKESTAAKTVCEGYLNIVPAFTSSTQTFVPGTVQIITPPANGTAIINPTTGVIGYVPNFGFAGTDTIIYKFCGNAPEFIDCEQITLTLTIAESPTVNNATIRTCFLESNIATGEFDLTNASVTVQPGVTKKYYPSLTDANNQTNEILTPANYIAPNGVVYVRVSNANGCYRVAVITLIVLAPIKSTVLIDKEICIENKTTLDAGTGFDGYSWSTGATTQVITDVTVGTYWVDLRTGDCTTRQTLNVYPTKQPVISTIEITNNDITVIVVGGTAPYQYSIDNVKWQDSNVFTDLTRGDITVYVRDSFSCAPIEVTVTIPNIVNVITPNGDGVNDVLDYSSLANKPNLVLSIFDRYGVKIFEGNKDTGYKWDGTINKTKKVSTGNYWFSITWNENKNKTPMKFSGWILVKNRE
ncbi:gliding motility-associated C-terminal domain-containing protein [Chryseobacterium wangxinyae]|uniref:T9SS type B sorting domain-containing protein n=1 Tax=Chryseobacterium sp. CY350 TaxID=2997336 RepID=UPI002271855A|nr:gliding motility-associated C-terminal domain-containing protein [Chryseobacterium sp. CY350]MCY0978722.1 gliding motility-associated C-terminal domain-containing protein [Chryseobacterium sp. CY350]WBZ93897.1 gliding motility-associated C-terminal domain-containing protein [Chryseobacterium sp. CY350]